MNTPRHIMCVMVVLLFAVSNLLANSTYPSHFSNDRDLFIKELEQFMTEKKRAPLVDIFNKFERAYHAGQFNEVQVRKLIEVSNNMLDRKLAAAPYFQQYLECLLILNAQSDASQWDSWQNTWDVLVSDAKNCSNKILKQTLAFSKHFFTTSSLTQRKGSINWLVDASPIWGIENHQPVLQFSKTKLTGKGRKNKLTIANASGYFSPINNIWEGEAGETDWSRLGREEIVVSLKAYSINVKRNQYEAKEAYLHHEKLWPGKAIKGKFIDKILQSTRKENAIYPQFTASENSWMEFKDQGIRVRGYFQLKGNHQNMLGLVKDQAILIKHDKEGVAKFRASSVKFNLKDDCVLSEFTKLSIPCYEQDSIYHPGVEFRYIFDQERLHVQRNPKHAEGRRPFVDSYTRMNIEAKQISWWLAQGSLVVNQKNLMSEHGSGDVVLSSPQFFNVRQFRKIQGPASRNPISNLKWLSEKLKSRVLTATEFAKSINPNLSAKQILPLLEELTAGEFIDWDREEMKIQVLPKAIHYAAADQEQSDYDQIRLVSNHFAENANFHFDQKRWEIAGVNIIEFSGERQVAAKPLEGKVTLLQNRGMEFDGKLFSGLGVFQGERMQFDYEPFLIRLDSVAYFDVFLNDNESYVSTNSKTPTGLSIGSRMENLTGILYIDRPDNKSGRDTSSLYPAFSSDKESYVFYEQADTNYERSNFFFALDPFKLKGLGDIKSDQMLFPGQMSSGDIFPNFRETLILQEDQSLGFQHQTPSEGYGLYQQRGKYNGLLKLSNEGFSGEGHFSYRWANIDATDIYFQPKRLTCSADKFELPEVRDQAVEVPSVVGRSVAIDWKPYQDSMYVRSADEAFELFAKPGYGLNGLLILTPDGLHGRGLASWPAGAVSADLLSFGAYSIQSDSCDLSIQTQGIVNELALATKNVKADLDFDQQIGFIRARIDTVTTSLPYNKYRTSMNSYDWDMKNERVHFHAGDERIGYFWCTDKDQEGIEFEGATADYDLKSSILKIGGVDRIQVSDTWVYPDSGMISILKDGKMERLKNARIVMDTLNAYHEITNASVEVFGKNSFTASGNYNYKLNATDQQIHFNSIQAKRIGKGKKRDRKVITVAETEVSNADEFYVGTNMRFKGKVNLQSDWAGLHFDGYARINDERLPETQWFRLAYKGTQREPILPISGKMESPDGHELSTGVYVSSKNGEVYPLILGYKHQKGDQPLAEVAGHIRYDGASDNYLLGDSMRVYHHTSRGTLLKVEKPTQGVTLEGPLQFGEEVSSVLTKIAGQSTFGKKGKGSATAQMMARLDFPLPDKLWKIVSTDLKSNSFDADQINYQTDNLYEKGLYYFIEDSKQLKQAISSIKSGSSYVPKDLGKASLFFSNIDLTWNPEERAFRSTNGKLGTFSIGEQTLHRWFKGYLKLRKPLTGGDRLQLYLKSPSGFYYYFSLNNGVLGMVSNNPEFSNTFEGLKEKELVQKTMSGEEVELLLLETAVAQRFMSSMK